MEYAVYKRRWYILGVLFLIAFLQGFQYNQFAAIYGSLETAFGWTVQNVALQPLYQALALSLGILPCAFLLEKYGVRKNMLLMAALTMVSFVVRCLPIYSSTGQAWLINLSCVLNGFASSIRSYVPVVISARWFQNRERTLATTVGISAGMAGCGLAPLLVPMLISSPDDLITAGMSKTQRDHAAQVIQHQYFVVTYVETSVALLAAIGIFVYFPDHPPKPPSLSAAAEKIDQLKCLKAMLLNGQFWKILLGFLLVSGGFFSWVDVMSIDLAKNGVAQKPAGLVSFFAYFVGFFGSMILAQLGDMFPKNLKTISIFMAALAALTAVWNVLITQNYIFFTLRQFYIAALLLGVASNTILCLALEIAAENLYPLDECLLSGVMMLCMSAVEFGFMVGLLLFDPSSGWMDWYILISVLLGTPFIVTLPNDYKRYGRDETEASVSAPL